ncbi:MAG: VanZ family protein [Pleurocapsa sp.]
MIELLALIKKYWIFTTLFILTIITVLSLWPLASLPPLPGTDKAHHFVAYAALMFPTALRKPNYWPIITLFFIGWSGAIELIQPSVNRYGEFEDLAANVGGLGCGFLAAKIIEWLMPVKSNPK